MFWRLARELLRSKCVIFYTCYTISYLYKLKIKWTYALLSSVLRNSKIWNNQRLIIILCFSINLSGHNFVNISFILVITFNCIHWTCQNVDFTFIWNQVVQKNPNKQTKRTAFLPTFLYRLKRQSKPKQLLDNIRTHLWTTVCFLRFLNVRTVTKGFPSFAL